MPALSNGFNAALDSVAALCVNYEKALGTTISPCLKEQLAVEENLWHRRNFSGHLTGSAILLNDLEQVLLIKHKFLGLWLAPGGHADPFEMPAETAARELAEETGVEGFELHPWHLDHGIPIDIDTHFIPANAARSEAAHFHHDFRYVFTANGKILLSRDVGEVDDIEWKPVSSLAPEYPSVYQRIRAFKIA